MGLLNSIVNFLNPEPDKGPAERPGRNDTCWCGSGKKYKKCHLEEDEGKRKKYSANCGAS